MKVRLAVWRDQGDGEVDPKVLRNLNNIDRGLRVTAWKTPAGWKSGLDGDLGCTWKASKGKRLLWHFKYVINDDAGGNELGDREDEVKRLQERGEVD
jgi:hypothetical protein